jgi:hypothetical protein
MSVLSLPFKFVHNQKSCPNSAATLLSLYIEAVLAFVRDPQKSLEFSHVGGGDCGKGEESPSANPDNAAAGGATDARCGGGGRGGRLVRAR